MCVCVCVYIYIYIYIYILLKNIFDKSTIAQYRSVERDKT